MILRIATAGVAVAALLAAPAPAQAAPPAFKVVKTTGIRGGDYLTRIVAPTRTSAFAFGYRDSGQRPVVFRYDGRTWHRAALPKAMGAEFSSVSASSAKDLWAAQPGNTSIAEAYNPFKDLFDSDAECPQWTERARLPLLKAARAARAAGRATERPSRLLRWNGTKWTIGATFKSAAIGDVVTRGPKDVWAFGLDRMGPASWHFNGKKWRRIATGSLIGSVTRGPGRTLWALSYGRTGMKVVRFDGHRWQDRTPRSIPPMTIPTKDKSGTYTFFSAPLASAGRAYLTAMTFTGKACDEGKLTTRTFTGTGRTWRVLTPPKKFDAFEGFLLGGGTGDGKGGFYSLGTIFTEDKGRQTSLLHLTSKGTWSSRVIYSGTDRREYNTLAPVPGTSSLWAAGSVEGTWDVDGFIARKGGK
ncbi:hypothetical protein [Actinocorallia longicatena]|uniref:BNR repeat neuraminidase n=1 Tax=Actinocorallia longicatena TaxID=111803 RepID=A0ABP6Q9V6_9ACTN